MKLDYLILALKNLKHRGIRSWLTLLGIFIGVTAVVALIGLGNGLQAAVGAQFGVSSTQALTVQAGGLNAFGPPGSGAVNKLTRDDSDAIGRLGTIEFATPRNLETAKIEYNDVVVFSMAVSVDDEMEREMYETMDLEADRGTMLLNDALGRIVIGDGLADGSKNGFDKDIMTGDNILVQDERFKVVGILKKKGSFMFDNIVLMYQDDLDDLFEVGDEVDVIGVKVKHPDLMDRAKEEIERLLRKRRDVKEGEEDFEVSTPDAILETVNSVLGRVKAFIVIIASISILVGALGIVNTMTTSVLERRKEIGIMKAIGGTNFQVFLQFFFESGMLGFVGGLVGIILGTLASVTGTLAINSFIGAELSPSVDFFLIGGALLGSFVVGAVAGIVPAMNAAKQNPVEALRG
ncbi:ABC transporter permease [archaeon]|jgi:putative ABC transport system permease protein|nr:ABC transporter permease [archaeon]